MNAQQDEELTATRSEGVASPVAAARARRRHLVAGASCWAAVGVALVALPGGLPGAVWPYLAGLLVGLLLAGGNVLLLEGLLGNGGSLVSRGRLGWVMLWAGKLTVLAVLIRFSLTELHVSPLTLAAGVTLALPAMLGQATRATRQEQATTGSAATRGGDHGCR